MTRTTIPSKLEQSAQVGRTARHATPRSAHRQWSSATDRADPVRLLDEQNETRLPWLVPIRHARMAVSPFTFYRGAARIMAADLATTPASGIDVQLGGDAHLSNFGAYASPERHLVVDANDFDETLRGPWEWDLKRLATSVMIAAQHLGFSTGAAEAATRRTTHAYRSAMSAFADMGYLEAWNRSVRVEDLHARAGVSRTELESRLAEFQRRAKRKTSLQALDKLTDMVDGRRRIRNIPPALLSFSDLPADLEPEALRSAALAGFEDYKSSLDDARHWLLDHYRPVDVGLKVVGVGSAGTRCLIILLEGRDERDPLFLQAKEAGPSVLEDHLQPSPYTNHGQRVVEGQRLVQAESDVFLGWTTGAKAAGRHFYLRQLRDWKGSVEIEQATPKQLTFYADLCGRTLARGHARSGDPAAIHAYAGGSDTLDKAIAKFAAAYAKQNLEDYHAFLEAIASGRLEAADAGA